MLLAVWEKYVGTRVEVGKSELRHTQLDSYKPILLVKGVLEKKQKKTITDHRHRQQARELATWLGTCGRKGDRMRRESHHNSS